MTRVQQIEQEIAKLPPGEVAELARWLSEYDAAVWDKEIEADAVSGRLDKLFEEAEKERASGKLRDWPPKQGLA